MEQQARELAEVARRALSLEQLDRITAMNRPLDGVDLDADPADLY